MHCFTMYCRPMDGADLSQQGWAPRSECISELYWKNRCEHVDRFRKVTPRGLLLLCIVASVEVG
jgi:hypothetical protein